MDKFLNYKFKTSTLIYLGFSALAIGLVTGEIFGLNQTIANKNGLIESMRDFTLEKNQMDEMLEYLNKLDKADGFS